MSNYLKVSGKNPARKLRLINVRIRKIKLFFNYTQDFSGKVTNSNIISNEKYLEIKFKKQIEEAYLNFQEDYYRLQNITPEPAAVSKFITPFFKWLNNYCSIINLLLSLMCFFVIADTFTNSEFLLVIFLSLFLLSKTVFNQSFFIKRLTASEKYIGLGVVGGLTMFNISNAQDNPKNNYKQVTEIRQEKDNIIIPENKLNEFLKNYTPKKKINNLEKITDAVKDGYVIDALDNTPLEGIEASLWVIDYGTLIDTIGPVNTNFQGYYSFSITGIENIVKTENIGEIKYQIINTPQIQLNLNKLSKVEIKIYDLLGKEIKTLLDEETSQKTINTNINNLASGVYFLKTIIDGKLYANKILKTENKYNYGKTTDKITQKNSTNKNLEKLATELGVVRVFEDPNNQYHKYQHTLVEPYAENKTENFALIPRMNLFNIHDPNYSVIDTIKTIRDFYWYFKLYPMYWTEY